MGTAPVYIHAIIPPFAGEYSLCVHKMHSNHSLRGGDRRRQGTVLCLLLFSRSSIQL
jgi:hypothetical protein